MSQEEPKQFQGNGPYREDPQEKPWPKKVISKYTQRSVVTYFCFIIIAKLL